MKNKQFGVDTIAKFINDLTKLTSCYKIKWETIFPKYDDSKFSQFPYCIRFNGTWNNNKFVLISKENKYNFEIHFNENIETVVELPLVDEDIIQKSLSSLFSVINEQSETYDMVKTLFENVDRAVMFLS